MKNQDNIPQVNRWMHRLSSNPLARLRLFCFPYAGGGTTIYHQWQEGLPTFIEVVSISLPGRELRFGEAAYQRISDLAKTLGSIMPPALTLPFVFFGHSLGALISFELARTLRREQLPMPDKLFVSGCPAPQLPYHGVKRHLLPESELIEQLRDLGGTPPELLDNLELRNLVLPSMRADFECVETYQCASEPPLACPITVFGGLQDQEATAQELEVWRSQTESDFSLEMYPGNHFFLDHQQSRLLARIAHECNQIV